MKTAYNISRQYFKAKRECDHKMKEKSLIRVNSRWA